ncbi:MAG TPA: energy transducer TonB [Kofleriaceae bacterium]|nr:energy transducer TonB [Kofleriaceae bacterium]
MFDNFTAARRKKLPRWLAALLLSSIAIHAAVIAAMVLHGWWQVDKLSLPRGGVTLAVTTPPPPPPAARKGAAKPTAPNPSQLRRAVSDTTQPVTLHDPQTLSLGDAGDQLGVADGITDGVPDGVAGTTCLIGCKDTELSFEEPPPCVGPDCKCTGDDCDEVPIVPQVAIEERRTHGDPKIYPPDPTLIAIKRDGVSRVVTTVKMCLSAQGTVQQLEVLKSSGYPAYDALIRSTMRTWRYEPFQVNGEPVPVCTSITFIYNQR